MKIQDLQNIEVISGGIAEEQQTEQDGFSLKQTLKNIPGSALRFGQDIASVVLHPIETTKGLGKLGAGTAQKLIPGEQAQEQNVDAVVDFFRERYGGIENIKKTVQEDPIGFLADASAVLSGGGLALRGAGTAGRLSKVSKAGKAIQKAGLATEPLTLAGKTAFISTKPLRVVGGSLIRESLGVTTGAGGEVIRQAFKNPTKEFRQALRGRVDIDNVLTSSREALDTMREQRASAYRSQLDKITKQKQKINIKPFKDFLDSELKKFNVLLTNKGLDFSKSVIADKAEAKRISGFISEVRKWKDTTPQGLDILKQRLDDFYTPSGRGRALTTAVANNLRQTLRKEIKGYEQMTRDYAETTKLIKEIEGTLSLKPGTRADTALKKITSTLRQNNEFRQELITRLDELTEKNITSQIAGISLSSGVPSGLIGRSMFAGIIGLGALQAVSPAIFLGLLFSSPRVVGEFLNALGLSNKTVNALTNFIMSPAGKQILISSFQAGRTN